LSTRDQIESTAPIVIALGDVAWAARAAGRSTKLRADLIEPSKSTRVAPGDEGANLFRVGRLVNALRALHSGMEQLLAATTLDVVVLRPGIFASNALHWRRRRSAVATSCDGRTAPIDDAISPRIRRSGAELGHVRRLTNATPDEARPSDPRAMRDAREWHWPQGNDRQHAERDAKLTASKAPT